MKRTILFIKGLLLSNKRTQCPQINVITNISSAAENNKFLGANRALVVVLNSVVIVRMFPGMHMSCKGSHRHLAL